MAIKSIRVSNFKSFGDLKVDLGAFNVLIGANASGKSNFVQVFRFLRDIVDHGLRNAISMQGGGGYLTNVVIGASRHLAIGAISDGRYWIGLATVHGDLHAAVRTNKVIYEFAISFSKDRSGFDIVEDKLTLKCDFVERETGAEGTKETRKLLSGDVTVSNVRGKLVYRVDPAESVSMRGLDAVSPFVEQRDLLPPTSLLIENRIPLFRFARPQLFLGDMSIYEIDPNLSTRAIRIIGKVELEEDGANLPIVVRSILGKPEQRRKLLNLLRDVLGFVDDVKVTTSLAERSLLLYVRETYTHDTFLPASFLSKGTIHVLALIVALYFDDSPLVIIEEPERNLHPFLIARVVDVLKEASEKKQIIVTTHNPEVVKHAGVENLLLVSRDKEGFSTITRPSDSEQVAVFLRNDIGVEDLFVQDLLGA